MNAVDMLTKKKEEKLATYSYAKRHGVLIVDMQNDHVKVVHTADCSPYAITELHRYLSLPLQLEEVNDDHFITLLTKNYETKAMAALQVAENIGDELDLDKLMEDLPKTTDLLESENDAPVIRLINALLREAVKQAASDIHFEPFEEKLAVRLRIDGILHNVLEVPHLLAPLLISRIKVMSKLDIAEKRLPQDGRITIRIAGRTIDVRVSTIPVSHGERVVLRLLDKKSIQLNLSELGMSDQLLETVKKMIAKPHGIILVTGPTGSGKTTSLYAMLTSLNVPGRNIMTVEDPIEYELSGIGQTQVNPKIEMTFARGLRAILRQDPNIVMIGEIRDLETVNIAIQASLTGHLVLSTLHTNTAIGAITRLRDMGVETFLLSSSLIGIIAQRLVRMLCNQCKEQYIPDEQECKILGIGAVAKGVIYRPRECEHCNKTGYIGRSGIYEIIVIDTKLRTMIHDNESEQQIEAYARTQLPSIREDGARLVLAGKTSLEEIIRVTSE